MRKNFHKNETRLLMRWTLVRYYQTSRGQVIGVPIVPVEVDRVQRPTKDRTISTLTGTTNFKFRWRTQGQNGYWTQSQNGCPPGWIYTTDALTDTPSLGIEYLWWKFTGYWIIFMYCFIHLYVLFLFFKLPLTYVVNIHVLCILDKGETWNFILFFISILNLNFSGKF